MTKTAHTVTLIDRTATQITKGAASIDSAWHSMNKAQRALFDSRADYLHAVVHAIDRQYRNGEFSS